MSDEGQDGAGDGRVRRASTGAATLDDVLNGGLPAGRTHLVTGTPGAGKSTLAMQFLQAGLDRGEECLFISTEQTPGELRDGFAPFDFELAHRDLSLTTLHALPTETDYGDEQLQLRTLSGEERLDAADVEFTPENLVRYLREGGDYDRVVLDSVSGLDTLADDQSLFRRLVLQLVRLFNDEFDATAVFTAEHYGTTDRKGVETLSSSDALQYSTHGVLRLWRESVEGEYHRFVDVMKMRGVAHDTRQYEIGFDDSGIHIIPRSRAHAEAFIEHDHQPTGIDGLDALLDGGLLLGAGTVLEHDGRANYDALITAILTRALRDGMSVTLAPSIDTNRHRLAKLLDGRTDGVDRLLDDDRLFVLDMVDSWDQTHENVFDVQHADAGLRYLFQTIDDRRDTDRHLSVVNTETKVHALDAQEARAIRYWQEANTLGDDDVLLDIHNPALMDDDLAAFHSDAARQVLRTWMSDAGLQYMTLRKSPTGHLGSSRVVEYVEEPPYVRVEPP